MNQKGNQHYFLMQQFFLKKNQFISYNSLNLNPVAVIFLPFLRTMKSELSRAYLRVKADFSEVFMSCGEEKGR
jgi:hypothetical protein